MGLELGYYVDEEGSERATTWRWSEPPAVGEVLEDLFERNERHEVVSYDPKPYAVSPYRVIKYGHVLVRLLK